MTKCSRLLICFLIFQTLLSLPIHLAFGQQTLGGLTGVVTDTESGILPGVAVTVVDEQTGLTRSQVSGSNGFYDFANLPIGTYTVSFTKDGFQTQKSQAVQIQGDRTATVNVQLKVGEVNTVVSVEAVPLMNAVDTTNGYVLDKTQIQSDSAADGELYGIGNSVARRERRVARWNRCPLWSGQCSHLGQRATRHQQ